MPDIQKVLIIGARPAGLAAALQLKSRNRLWPTVYGVSPAPSTLGGAIIVPSNGLRLLDLLGVYDEISRRAPKLPKATAYSSRGTKLGELELGSWSAKKTGYTSMRLGIPVHFDKRIVAVEEADDVVELAFSDGTRDTAQLLLGGLSVIYSFLPASSLPPSTSIVTSLTGTYMRHGLFAVTPCSASFDTLFWFFSYEVPVPSSGNNREGWEEQGRREEEDGLGDAAHATQPHSGQGVSMALEDASLLSRPRVEKFYGYASQRVGDRKKTTSWRQWLKEVLIWALLRLVIWTSLHKLGIEERSLLYNINDMAI
ncbi:hypothetical protein OIDMADRAFT_100207 [Oidiodendron maius Zn]|uniref:FAD-binding domain-containing protein n=1 Tax=Oidiodendron maius (strain Zn) TaxID=913774 RepID=A0A0C3HJN0_OIDMZ|nr:hypothetical protein OIDMADRAFT_100207 [Oidiodendron maius Zn]